LTRRISRPWNSLFRLPPSSGSKLKRSLRLWSISLLGLTSLRGRALRRREDYKRETRETRRMRRRRHQRCQKDTERTLMWALHWMISTYSWRIESLRIKRPRAGSNL
jgi:hypothetical protein